MKKSDLTLFLEINNFSLIFFVLKKNESNEIKIINELSLPVSGVEDNRISNFEKFYNIIKQNIYSIEQKLDYTFKEVVLILENFNPTFLNLSGYPFEHITMHKLFLFIHSIFISLSFSSQHAKKTSIRSVLILGIIV